MRDEEWRHGRVLLPCVAGFVLASAHGYSLGVMIGPIEQETGWSRAQIATGPLVLAIVALVAAPLIGSLLDRVGARRIALAGVPLYCAALAALSLAGASVWSWWGLWLLLALAAMSVSATVWTAAVNGVFVRNRGLALAITLCGAGLAAALIPMLTYALVEDHGWRGGYVGLALVAVAGVLPLVFCFFTTPLDRRRATADMSDAATLPGFEVGEGFRSPRFVKLALAAGMVALAGSAVTSNSVPILVSQGLGRGAAAGLAGLIGIGSIVGRLGGGVLLDRLPASRVAGVSVLMPVLSVALLLTMPGDAAAAGAAMLVMGLAVGTELDACAYLAARHFGLRSFGTLFGAINGILLFGNGIAPLAASTVYDATGSYVVLLWAIVPACAVSAALFFRLGPYPAFDEPAR